MYIFGGFNSNLREHFNDLYEFNPLSNIWRKLSSCGEQPCRRRRQACVLVNDRIFLFGGTRYIFVLSCVKMTEYEYKDVFFSPQSYKPSYLTDSDEQLVDHSDMFVLDMKPSLKTFAMIAVRKYSLDESILPKNIRFVFM